MRHLPVLTAATALALSLSGCGGTTPAPAPAPAPTTGTATTAPAPTAAPSSGAASGGEGKTAKGSYATLAFPQKLGEWSLMKPPQPKDILTSANYLGPDQKTIMSVAVSKGAQAMYADEVSMLKGAKTSADGTYTCGDTGVVGAQCVAKLSDSLVRLKSFGSSNLTMEQADGVMKEWLAAQK